MRRALVVVPTFAGVLPRPLKSFMELIFVAGRVCREWEFSIDTPERLSLPTAMSRAARTMLTQGFDVMLAFDDDCFPPYDVIPRLLAHYDAGRQFVAGVGVMRGYPHTTTVAKVFDEGPTILQKPNGASLSSHKWLDDVDELEPLAEVDFCGVPAAMIARSVFETVPEPWFGLHGEDGGTVTHDVFFCRRLKKHGIPVLVDTSLKCGHLADAPIITFENRTMARELVG